MNNKNVKTALKIVAGIGTIISIGSLALQNAVKRLDTSRKEKADLKIKEILRVNEPIQKVEPLNVNMQIFLQNHADEMQEEYKKNRVFPKLAEEQLQKLTNYNYEYQTFLSMYGTITESGEFIPNTSADGKLWLTIGTAKDDQNVKLALNKYSKGALCNTDPIDYVPLEKLKYDVQAFNLRQTSNRARAMADYNSWCANAATLINYFGTWD